MSSGATLLRMPAQATRPAPRGWMGGSRIRFDANELAGAFGDIGTDLPLLIGMILACQADCASVFIVFGVFQIFSGLVYGMPMAIQPLKAVAAVAIALRIDSSIVYGAGLSIGLLMLILTVTGLLDRLARFVPKAAIRGVQFGLGLQLCLLAARDYMPADGAAGCLLAAGALLVMLLRFRMRRRYLPVWIVLIGGVVYAVAFGVDLRVFASSFGLAIPRLHVPSPADVAQGFLTLALLQIPLSLGNSILATHQLSRDLFPDRPVPVRRIGWTYSLLNLVAPFVSGLPVCHGSGGMAGHYALGGRTGGSVVLYGLFYLVLGVFFSRGVFEIVKVFPLPILGVILFVEGLTLVALLRDLLATRTYLVIAAAGGLIAIGLPYGYLLALLAGILLTRLTDRYRQRFSHPPAGFGLSPLVGTPHRTPAASPPLPASPLP